ncbi:Cof-type HAD-IIB family hydrolase [Gorillibacterium timonense]|uniref:Cof-type HAD-IIB family hydrolase n=1 Tax=Gorillibacterium timonense TaxID=1689269 RepID=UPI00071E2EB3|nr:Cof-type HAD-IIB family hydrolase [Gorillibacterium timonense]
MIKLFASDLDGTLLDRHRRVSPKDRAAIETASREGCEICFASGRMFTELNTVMNEFEARFHSISQNGATVHTKERALLASSSFKPELAAQLLQVSREFHLESFVHSSDDSFYLEERTERTLPYEARIMTVGTVCGDLEAALRHKELVSSKFSHFGGIERLRLLQAELTRRFQGHVNVFISDKDCLDVMPLNVSKGAGLSVLTEHLGVRPDEVACIGDSYNDLSMFSFTPHSFAMEGAPDEVKKEARYVVSSVAEAIDLIFSSNQSARG